MNSTVLKVLLLLMMAHTLTKVCGLKCFLCGWPESHWGNKEGECHNPVNSVDCSAIRGSSEKGDEYCLVHFELPRTKDRMKDIRRRCAYETKEYLQSSGEMVVPQCNNDSAPPESKLTSNVDGFEQKCYCTEDNCNSVAIPKD